MKGQDSYKQVNLLRLRKSFTYDISGKTWILKTHQEKALIW